MVKKIKSVKHLLSLLLAIIVSLPPFTSQILPTIASYHQTAVKNENLKNKKVSYKEIRERKHSKNKPNLKNQTVPSCQISVVTKTETLSSARQHTSSVWSTINNKAYIFAGNAASGYLNEIVEYDASTAMVTTKTEVLPLARDGFAAVYNPVNNKIYIFGGYNSTNGPLNQIVEYDPNTGVVTTKSETLPSSRSGCSGVYNPVNRKIYIFGGWPTWTQIVEYDPATGAIAAKSETLPKQRWGQAAVWNPLNNKAYLFGGWQDSSSSIVEYDPSTGTVTTKAETLPIADSGAPAVWNPNNNKIYIFGGSSSLNRIVEYDPTTGVVTTKTERIPTSTVTNTSAVWNPINNKAYVFGGWSGSAHLNQIFEYTPCNSPSNPSVSSVTINGVSQTVASSYRITAGQTFVANVSATDAYPGNKVTISCNLPTGMFTSSPALIGTGRLEFTPDATNVGNTYTFTFSAASDSGVVAASTVSFTVSVGCSSPDNGCTGGNICVQSSCCAPCKQPGGQGKCASDPSCVFTPTSQPPPQIAAPPTALPISPSPTPSPTATPATNVTNSGNTTTSQGSNIPPPAPLNTTPQPQPNIFTPEQVKKINDVVQSAMVIDIGLIKKNMPVDKPPAVKSDSASYIDFSKDGVVIHGK